MALYAIGDIHGCVATLESLLLRINATPEDHLVFVGDYLDRGPNSKAVIDKLLALEGAASEGTGPACTFLRGNHDQMMLDYVDFPGDPDVYELWSVNGGISTLQSYEANGRLILPEAHIDFLRSTRLVHEAEGYVFVHAGLDPARTIAENLETPSPEVVLWTRTHLSANLKKWEMPVVCGHTPQREPLNEPKLINIDTGAVYHYVPGLGMLTAVRLPDREFLQVEYVG